MDFDDSNEDKPQKRKHVTLTIQEKLDIINLVESKKFSRQYVANRYGIGKSTVHDIHKRRDQIRKFASKSSSDVSKRRRLDVKAENASGETDWKFAEDEPEEFIVGNMEELENIENEENSDDSKRSEQKFVLIYEEEFEQKPIKMERSENKRRSNTLTIRQKYDILKQVEEGRSVPYICNQYCIGRTTVYDFIKRKQEIIDYIEKSSDETRKTFKKSSYPEVEQKITEWCEKEATFSKQEFFDQCKRLFTKYRSAGQFNGSWSWCRRFFDRHPQFKGKLVGSDGEPLDKSDLSISRGGTDSPPKSSEAAVRFPELESELLRMCLEQKSNLCNVLISDMARTLFDDLELKGTFNPTSAWVEKFLQRHPELSADEELPQFINEAEYIVEELEEDLQDSVKEEVIIEEEEVTEVEAADCLTLLVKFAQQRGNFQLENLLDECKEVMMQICEGSRAEIFGGS